MPGTLILQHHDDGRVTVAFRPTDPRESGLVSDPFSFAFPLSPQDLEDLRWSLQDSLNASADADVDAGAARAPAIAAKVRPWGEALFRPLFGPGAPGRTAYARAREARAEVAIVSADPAILALPWELLWHPDRPTPPGAGHARPGPLVAPG